MKTSLLITYEVNGRALALARVTDRKMIRDACRQALREKRSEANQLKAADDGLGIAGEVELTRMQDLLTRMVPDFVVTA